MKRLSLILAIAFLLIGIPVQAQITNNRPIIQPPPGIRPVGVLIQDDKGQGFMTFDLRSGAFKYDLCEYGYIQAGVGEVKIDGCNVYFSAITEEYSVFASVNMCDHQAKCVIEVFSVPDKGYDIQPITEYLVDSDMLNSKEDCSVVAEK
jgi:hypothetical protein